MVPIFIKTLVTSFVALILFTLPFSCAYADTDSYRLAQLGPGFEAVRIKFMPGEPNTLTEVIAQIIKVVLSFIAVIAVGALVAGGFMYITAFGDEEKAAKAKKTILYALIGIFIVLAAAIIINVILYVFRP